MSKWKTSPCKGCGAPIVWAEDDAGKRHPLDPKAPTFLACADARGTHAKRMPDVLVSHFATCPTASTFSGKSKKAEAAAAAPATLQESEHFTGHDLVDKLNRWSAEMRRSAELVAPIDERMSKGNAELARLLARAAEVLAETPRRVLDADPAAMLQPAPPWVNDEGTLCGLCDSTHQHEHPELVCVRCGVVGLAENMRAHICTSTYRSGAGGAKPLQFIANSDGQLERYTPEGNGSVAETPAPPPCGSRPAAALDSSPDEIW